MEERHEAVGLDGGIVESGNTTGRGLFNERLRYNYADNVALEP